MTTDTPPGDAPAPRYATEASVDALRSELAELRAKIERRQSLSESELRRLSELEARVRDLDGAVKQLESKVSSVDGLVREALAELKANSTDTREVKGAVGTLQKRVDELPRHAAEAVGSTVKESVAQTAKDVGDRIAADHHEGRKRGRWWMAALGVICAPEALAQGLRILDHALELWRRFNP